jgi:hypothetical protein
MLDAPAVASMSNPVTPGAQLAVLNTDPPPTPV